MNFNPVYHKLNMLAARMFTRLMKRSFKSFGRRSLVFFPAEIRNPDRIEVGEDVIIRAGCWLNAVDEWAGEKYDGHIVLGDHCALGQGVEISACDRITLGRYSGIGKNSVVSDHIHDYRHVNVPNVLAPLSRIGRIEIQEEATVMANCIIAPGVTIGRHSFVGGGSVVLQDIPPFCMAAGNPARIIRRYSAHSGEWERV